MKYFATLISGFFREVPDELLHRYGAINRNRQFNIVCKAKSRSAAERRVKEILHVTTNRTIFRPDHTSETGNKYDIEMCDIYEAIIFLDANSSSVCIGMANFVEEFEKFNGK